MYVLCAVFTCYYCLYIPQYQSDQSSTSRFSDLGLAGKGVGLLKDFLFLPDKSAKTAVIGNAVSGIQSVLPASHWKNTEQEISHCHWLLFICAFYVTF